MRIVAIVEALMLVLVVSCSQPESAGKDTSAADTEPMGKDTAVEVKAPEDTWAPETVAPDTVAQDLGPAPDLGGACGKNQDCEDYDPCTMDICQDGACSNTLYPPGFCCKKAGDCEDGISCTIDECLKGKCSHSREDSSCCTTDADCNDFDACTLDVCVANTCSHKLLHSKECWCQSVLDCDDGLACTKDECTNLNCTMRTCEDGICVWTLAANAGSKCCQKDADCDDGDGATQDSCVNLTCQNLPPRPCLVESHCDDGNPCTTDLCQEQRCVHEALAGCCRLDGECDDGLAVTTDYCKAQGCVHSPTAEAKPCQDAGVCGTSSDCATFDCDSGFCSVAVAESPLCCSQDADCEAPDKCHSARCTDFSCESVAVTGPVLQKAWSFDDNTTQGFELDPKAQNVGWQVDTELFYSAPAALYFGNAEKNSINNGSRVSGKALSPVFTAGADPVKITLQVFLDVEPISSRDLFFVELAVDGSWSTVANKNDYASQGQNKWLKWSINLPAGSKGKLLQLRLVFDSVDAVNNSYRGVVVDDIEVSWPCG